MEILDFACQMERDGYEFYLASAEQLSDPAAQRMLKSLAEDEKRHEQIILEFKEGIIGQAEGRVLGGVKNVFEELVRKKATFFNHNDSLGQILRKGIGMEIKSEELYQQLAQQAQADNQRKLWQKLAEEEKKHEKLLSLTLEYIDKPEAVLENAEFLFYGYDEAP